VKRIVIVGKYQPHEIIGAKEVMLDASCRFLTAIVTSKTATMFKLKSKSLAKITLSDSKQVK